MEITKGKLVFFFILVKSHHTNSYLNLLDNHVILHTGIHGRVEVDGQVHKNWKIYSFEFPPSFIERSVKLSKLF
jgi:hypothetical protein